MKIRKHLDWKGLRKHVHDLCRKCESCQTEKSSGKNYGKLLPKEAEVNAWDTLCVDIIDPYKIKRRFKKDLKPLCVTMIDPVIGWLEMAAITYNTIANVVNVAELTWFTKYSLPQNIIFGSGT